MQLPISVLFWELPWEPRHIGLHGAELRSQSLALAGPMAADASLIKETGMCERKEVCRFGGGKRGAFLVVVPTLSKKCEAKLLAQSEVAAGRGKSGVCRARSSKLIRKTR